MPHNVGVAGVVDERQGPVAGGSDLTLDTVLDTVGWNLNLSNLVSITWQVLEMSQKNSYKNHR